MILKSIKIMLIGCGLVAMLISGCGGHGSGVNSAQLDKYRALLNKAIAGKPTGHSRIPADAEKRLAKRPIGRAPIEVGSIYFDETNQVWVRVDALVTETGEFGQIYIVQWDYAFFQDQALTITAGRDYLRRYVANGKDIGEAGLDYLSGPGAGTHSYQRGIYDPVTQDTDLYFEVRDPRVARLVKNHTIWTESTGIQSNAGEQIYDDGDHIWSTSTWNRNGNVSFGYSDQSGYAVNFNYVPDGSGGFTLAGPPAEVLLPASGSWNAAGTGTVNFADGGSIPFILGETGFNF
jgi:hypothetical protein